MRVDLRPKLGHRNLNTMNLLNELTEAYPEAISLAPGRPFERLFDAEASLSGAVAQARLWAEANGYAFGEALNRLCQYGKTNGLILEQIAKHLDLDEGIHVPQAALMMTTGAQEAMAILLMGLFEPGKDVLIVPDPTYVGITGLAEILGVKVKAVAMRGDQLELHELRLAIDQLVAEGLRPRAIYHVPDFNNPLGSSMPLADRGNLLALAHERNILIFEDNPYGMFAYDAEPMPSIKSMDLNGHVIYLGTFSKSIFPGVRMGYLVADQEVVSEGKLKLLAEELSKVKSFLTVNTSPICQALVAGVLTRDGGSLKPLIARKLPHYRASRDLMLESLEKSMAEIWPSVSWNRPGGGFFLTLRTPFSFTEREVRQCAADYGVIVCPMSLFSILGGRRFELRLAFGGVSPELIPEGVARLARYLTDNMDR